jgi:hypothetical protein
MIINSCQTAERKARAAVTCRPLVRHDQFLRGLSNSFIIRSHITMAFVNAVIRKTFDSGPIARVQ